MPWLEDLVTLATNASVGTLGTDLFTSTAANVLIVPSGSMTITETPGGEPERTQNSVSVPAYINVRAQFLARAKTPELARLKAREYYLTVCGIRNQFINSGWYREITPLQEPFDLGKDDRGQCRYVFNVRGIKRPEVIA